jgi:methionyl aminopeptidase
MSAYTTRNGPPQKELRMTVESDKDLTGLRNAGRVVRLAIEAMRANLQPGMTTAELDTIGAEVFERHGARSAPQLVYDFPGVNCISVNDEAVHGVPGDRLIEPGDLVKIDVTAELDGYMADAAISVALPGCPSVYEGLEECAQEALKKAIAVARAGRPLNKIGRVVETIVRRRGFTVLTALSGHGVGRNIHEEPTIPNHFERRLTAPLTEGLVATLEPIITSGTDRTTIAADGWTTRTGDGHPSAHYEHTIVITKGSPIVLTAA